MVHQFTSRSKHEQRHADDADDPARLRHRRKRNGGIADAIFSATRSAVSKAPKINFAIRSRDEDDESDWWFAGTAVPLLAATIGPLANVLSIAALVTSWRMCLVDGVDPVTCDFGGDPDSILPELTGVSFADPRWCYWLNVVSLIMGGVGNLFLLFNFTGFVRYIIALPMTIIMWYFATAILIAIEISMNSYVPPIRPYQTYTQGFWYGVLAAILYLAASMLLMVNMLGYFLGHFPQHFELTDSQRTLILQTMLFFVWLAAGGGIFAEVEKRYGTGAVEWKFVDSLYFSDVTILTVGFGDLVPSSDLGRGLVFPYSVGGIIMLGLVISSISKFATELGSDKVVSKHRERSRSRTLDRVVSSVDELRARIPHRRSISRQRADLISAPTNPVNRSEQTRIQDLPKLNTSTSQDKNTLLRFASRSATFLTPTSRRSRQPRLLLLREERDRFNTMRRIEATTQSYKRYTALGLSTLSFSLVWLIGALVFYFAELQTQNLSYFQALYFAYVSLLTIGYGDLAPKSNIGRPFFVVWSLLAVPTMTILVSAMGDTVISGFKQGTERIADVTILPRVGLFKEIADIYPAFNRWIERRRQKREEHRIEERKRRGFEVGPPAAQSPSADRDSSPTQSNTDAPRLETIARETDGTHPLTHTELAARLASAIQRVALDLRAVPPRRYQYEEWVEFTRLIRFSSRVHPDGIPQCYDSANTRRRREDTLDSAGTTLTGATAVGGARDVYEDVDGDELIEWDWIGQNSPMMAKQTEAEFVLDRLCESMSRYIRRVGAEGRRDKARDVEDGDSSAPV